MWGVITVSVTLSWGKKASISLSRQVERACVNTNYPRVSSNRYDAPQTPATHTALLSPALRASSAGKAFVLLHLLMSRMHHVGGFKCVIVALGMKYLPPY